MIQNLAYELGVLAKAVQHKNLSAAAAHIGLSQPQLSRVIHKIESELNVLLLDRTARRKSGWTPAAQELALIFSKGMQRLESEIFSLAQDREVETLRIATLEGLSPLAMPFVNSCFKKLKMKYVYLDVLDFKELDSQFLSGQLDLIFTVRAPSQRKYQNWVEVGFQQMEKRASDPSLAVMSPYEFAGLDRKESGRAEQTLISNSLAIRQTWLQDFGGTGILPTEAKVGRGKGHYTVYLLGSDLLSPRLWEKLTKLI